MMLFKLSLKNIRKSFKDYAIYFLTLILGVAIFYVFNALDSQRAMIAVSESKRMLMDFMVTMLSGVSVGVALILGFLIIYANNFLIKRRKKEFAVYMMLGMGKRDVSGILFGETILIGIFSLGIGLLIGVFASQFMSILVAKMFEIDMSAYVFTFSKGALIKTVACFGIMYFIVILFNAFILTKYQLIDLLQAKRKTEHSRLKNSFVAVVVFLIAVSVLGYAYYEVTIGFRQMSRSKILIVIALGCVSTYFIFWSLAGFLLKLFQRFKRIYLNGLNAFVLRQINSNINTSVFSMTVICLLFFVTICVLSSGLSVNNTMKNELKKLAPVDINIEKLMDLPTEGYTEEQVSASQWTVTDTLRSMDYDMSLFKDMIEVTEYTSSDYTMKDAFGSIKEKVMEQYPFLLWDAPESIMGISDYNKVAQKYGLETFDLEKGHYIVICNFTQMETLRNEALSAGVTIQIGDSILQPQFPECQDGFIYMANVEANIGITLVPDDIIEKEMNRNISREKNLFLADYNGETKQEKQQIENIVLSMEDKQPMLTETLDFYATTKITIYESTTGLAATATFIAIYLGIVFLIAGAALLALKELSESADNQERYRILNKIGADKTMQNRALLWQMGIFFGMPMLLAIIHSVFGIQYAQNLLSVMYRKEDMIVPILVTAGVLIVIYGVYFVATYFGCKRIIEE